MNELALFAGAGGGILGGHLLGFKTVCAVDGFPSRVDQLKALGNAQVPAVEKLAWNTLNTNKINYHENTVNTQHPILPPVGMVSLD